MTDSLASWGRKLVTREQFDEYTKPRLMLFMSVDMENSTRLKQNYPRHHSHDWLGKVVHFLEEFPTIIQASRDELASEKNLTLEQLRLWKFQGDEIIFAINIVSPTVADLEIQALGEAIRKWNESIVPEKESKRLFLKGTAWLAGFPVANVVIPVNKMEDYVGPSMDAGFRLSKFSSARRLVLSVDLAWWLLENKSNQEIRFDGRHTIKGLAEGIGYPILWVETKESKYQAIEDELLGRTQQGDFEKMKNLCDSFIEEFGIPRFPPFLYSSSDPEPPEYQKRLALAREELKSTVFFISDDAGGDQGEKTHPDAAALMRKLKEAKKTK
jgi:hypothetical protein